MRNEVISEQKKETEKNLITHQLHYDFKREYWDKKMEEAEKKEDREVVAHQMEKDLSPYRNKIDINTKYLEWLESLDTESAEEEKQEDTSEEA